MRISKIVLAALVSLGLAGAAPLAIAAPFQNKALCVDQISQLDADRDGFVDDKEWPSISGVHRNVDFNGDGRASQDEIIASCDDGIVEIF
jgi:hypothetical protein